MLLKTAFKLTIAVFLVLGVYFSWSSFGNQCQTEIQSPDCNAVKEVPSAEEIERTVPQSDLELDQFDYPEVIPNTHFMEKQQLVLNEGIIIHTDPVVIV
ncbi:MAG: hypothetical protein HWE14_02540 [Flavobacteriia bacterium]|nr:hypothetical protein [Flavobacteriia bacterium]